MSYELWKREVDKEIDFKCGMVSDDIPDYNYRDAYDNGQSPTSTAKKAIRAAKEF